VRIVQALRAGGCVVAMAVGRLTGPRREASTMGLAALVGTQLGQTLVLGRRSPLVLLISLTSAAVLVTAVEAPGVSHFLGCTPIGPVTWSVVLACSACGRRRHRGAADPDGGHVCGPDALA
jgi:cation-transporting ATPase I